MITFKQIQYALALEQTLHFHRAANACAVSQSTLSTAIAELEKHLGAQIFERDNKKVLISPFGRRFLDKARLIKVEVEDLERLAASLKQPLSYPMSLGVIPTIGPYMLPKVLPALRESYPDFRLRIVEEQTHTLMDMVRNGDIDTAVLALPYALDGLLSFEFWEEDFYWVTHRDDARARQKGITSDELRQSGLMLLKEGHCLKAHALAACRLAGRESDDSFAAASLTTLVQMVAGRLGTTLVPRMALDQLVSGSPELKGVHLDEPGPHRRIAFVVRPNYPGVNNIELLVKLFRRELQRHLPAPGRK